MLNGFGDLVPYIRPIAGTAVDRGCADIWTSSSRPARSRPSWSLRAKAKAEHCRDPLTPALDLSTRIRGSLGSVLEE